MLQNYRSMPSGLKLLTACAAAAPLAVFRTLLPGEVLVGGQHITSGLWWRSGAGVLFATPAVLFTLGSLGMMRRANGARALYVTGFLLSAPAVLWIPQLVLGSPRAGIVDAAPLVAMALGVAAYVYGSARVRSYFRGDGPRGSLASPHRTR